MPIPDTPKPKIQCPECESKEFFYHCAKHISIGESQIVYDWGDLVTCLNCKCQWHISSILTKDNYKKLFNIDNLVTQ